MATVNADISWHGTVMINTETIVNVSTPSGSLSLRNRSSNADVYFRVDGTTPAVGADGAFVIRPGEQRLVSMPDSNNPSVRLITSVAAAFSVELPY